MATAAAEGGPQLLGRELGVERLWAERGQGGQLGQVVADHRDPTEPSDVAEPEAAAVVEHPPGPVIGVGIGPGRIDPELAGHAQVDHERSGVGQTDDQVLAPPPDAVDPGPDRRRCRRELGRRVAPGGGDGASGDERLEAPSDGLHLGQLGHDARR